MTEPREPLPYATPEGRASGLAIAALTLGAIAIPLDVAFFAGVIPGLAAILCGSIACRNIRRDPGLTGKGMAQAGIVLGLLSLLLAIGCGILFFGGRGM